MKTLTRLLEAVYARPGSAVSEAERLDALTTLSLQSMTLGSTVAKMIGEDPDRSAYIRAMAMDAVVGLVTKSWEQGIDLDWPKIIAATADVPEIAEAANALAQASYRPVETLADASDRLATSMHSAFWQVYTLGESVDGMTARLAAEIVRDCATYLQGKDKFVADNDLYVSWMQGSVRRLTDLVCAEMRARFGAKGMAPTPEDVQAVLAVARSGFEGVENYAQSILEKPGPSAVPRPVDQ